MIQGKKNKFQIDHKDRDRNQKLIEIILARIKDFLKEYLLYLIQDLTS